MTTRPKLYPGHQHQWAYVRERQRPDTTLVRCTVCDLQMPRNVVEAFDTIRSEIADARAEIAGLQTGTHYPRCNPECDGDTHMLLADEPERETRADA